VRPRAEALILQHEDDAPPGLVLVALEACGVPWEVVRLDRGEPLPEPDAVAFAISLGSEAAADDELDWIATELAWLRAADRADTPVLGICFGAQALALALGGGVSRARRPERGWVEITTTEPELIAPGPWLTWHNDEITLPGGAQLVAHNASGVQAFRVRGHLGVQFHPEATPLIVAAWARTSRDGGVDVQALNEVSAREAARAASDARTLFTGFVEVASRPRSR
jgi:GMP synthase-like glutamine amidotransferase